MSMTGTILPTLSTNIRTFSIAVILFCLTLYYLMYHSTQSIQTKNEEFHSEDAKPVIRSDQMKRMFNQGIPSRTRNIKATSFRNPTNWKRFLAKAKRVRFLGNPQKHLSVVSGHGVVHKVRNFRKRVIKRERPGVFHGDCYTYTSEGVSRRPPHVMKMYRCEKRLPKAMIAGVKKCGTMTLTHYLSLHPLVAIRGEVEFPSGQELTTDDLKKWRDSMPWSSPRMFLMTGKPLKVLWRNNTAARMQSLMEPNAKLIMIIRDPVVRALSDYVHESGLLLKNGSQDRLPPFSSVAIDPNTGNVNETEPIISRGIYTRKFRNLKNHFGPDRVPILDGEAFVHDPLPTMIQTEKFLGLPPFFERKHFQKNPDTEFYCAHVPERPNFECANPKIKGRPHPTVDDDIQKKLHEYYRPFNLEMAKEAGIYFPWLFL